MESQQQQLMLFAEDSLDLAKTFQLPESKPGLAANAPACGQSLLELLATLDPDTRLWKTSQLSCLEMAGDGLAEFSETWPRSGMMRNGIAYRLPTLAQYKTEIEYGLLPTLPKTENKDFSKASTLARLDKGGRVARRICSKSTLIHSAEIVGLNPSFAEVVAGFPIGHTELER